MPIDDENTLSVAWFNNLVPGDEPFEQTRIPYWTAPIKDRETGRWISTHIMNQDFIAWVGQGTIADRTQEHLGESDRGVILMRKRMLEEAQVVANGGEPKAIIRDPEQNRKLYLPRVERALRNQIAHGQTRAPRNQYLAGQPQVILDEMDRIWAQRAQGVTKDSAHDGSKSR